MDTIIMNRKLDLSLFKTKTMKLDIKQNDLIDKHITLFSMEYNKRTVVLAKEL